jgi:hypothetical protein
MASDGASIYTEPINEFWKFEIFLPYLSMQGLCIPLLQKMPAHLPRPKKAHRDSEFVSTINAFSLRSAFGQT